MPHLACNCNLLHKSGWILVERDGWSSFTGAQAPYIFTESPMTSLTSRWLLVIDAGRPGRRYALPMPQYFLMLSIVLACSRLRQAACQNAAQPTGRLRTVRTHGSSPGSALGIAEPSDLHHQMPSVRQTRRLHQNTVEIAPAIDPLNSKGSSALNQQVYVDDTSAAPCNSVGFLKLSADTDQGCAAVLLDSNIIYTSSTCVNADNDYTKLVFYPGRSTCA